MIKLELIRLQDIKVLQELQNPLVDRVSAKVNLDANIAKWLKLNASLNYINTKLNNTNDNAGVARGGVVLSTLNTPAGVYQFMVKPSKFY